MREVLGSYGGGGGNGLAGLSSASSAFGVVMGLEQLTPEQARESGDLTAEAYGAMLDTLVYVARRHGWPGAPRR